MEEGGDVVDVLEVAGMDGIHEERGREEKRGEGRRGNNYKCGSVWIWFWVSALWAVESVTSLR